MNTNWINMTLKQLIKQTLNLPESHFNNYCSDLLILYSERTYKWLNEYYEFPQNIKIVTGNVKGSNWYGKQFIEIPFAYTEYNKSIPQINSIISEEDLLKLLPSGSGIDCDWEITEHKNGNVTAKNSFHSMDEHGGYDGYMDFSVKIFKVKESKLNKLKGPSEGQYQIITQKGDIDYKITCNENQRKSFYGLKGYLEDTIYHSIESILTPMRDETLTEQEIDAWKESH